MGKLFNLARMSTTTTGTGTITLGAAVSSYLSFASAGVANGDVVSYGIEDGSAREVGYGTYTASGTTLTRNVITSTNSNNKISLSGSAQVFLTPNSLDLGMWQTYTPTWTASGTAPAIGNGTITGRYTQIGRTVYCNGTLTSGSTTTYGTGTYYISLPVTAANVLSAGAGQGLMADSSAGPAYAMGYWIGDTTARLACWATGSSGTSGFLSATFPWTWASGDSFRWACVYEAA